MGVVILHLNQNASSRILLDLPAIGEPLPRDRAQFLKLVLVNVKSASTSPRSARATASLRLLSAIRSRRANLAKSLVLKIRISAASLSKYSAMNYNFKLAWQAWSATGRRARRPQDPARNFARPMLGSRAMRRMTLDSIRPLNPAGNDGDGGG